MVGFRINGTDFGIDPARSRCALARRLFRGPALMVEVAGDPARFEELRQADGSPWAWALYPPAFSLRGLPVPKPAGDRPVERRLTPADVEGHDIGLYFMEHHPVSDVVVRLGPGSAVVISGRVELFGKPGEFRVEWGGGPGG